MYRIEEEGGGGHPGFHLRVALHRASTAFPQLFHRLFHRVCYKGPVMTAGQVSMLLGFVALLAFACLETAFAGLLVWATRRLMPHETLEAKVEGLRAIVDGQQSQIITLRTKKANARSQEKQRQAQPPPEEQEDDPFLDGLTEEDRALFR